jgi:hypothetical protein
MGLRLLFGRTPRPPVELTALLARDDRVVSWADVEGGGVVLASRLGLWWPFPDGPRRIGWERIDKATWSDGVLRVIEADVVDGLLLVDREPVSAQLTVPRDLPPTVRKRVEASVVSSELVTGGRVAMRVVGRRVPGRDGITWWARLEPSIGDTPETRAIVHDVLGARREQQRLSDAGR